MPLALNEHVSWLIPEVADGRLLPVYRVSGDAKNGSQSKCLTCNGSSSCQYIDATFSHTGQYYILACLGPGVPSYSLRHADGRTSQLRALQC